LSILIEAIFTRLDGGKEKLSTFDAITEFKRGRGDVLKTLKCERC